MTYSPAQLRMKRAEYDRHFKGSGFQHRSTVVTTMPEDIERVEVSAPCFNCGARGGCKHRAWLAA